MLSMSKAVRVKQVAPAAMLCGFVPADGQGHVNPRNAEAAAIRGGCDPQRGSPGF
jgi:hypothetical protein